MARPMNFDQLYPGRFLKAGHFEQPRTLRIKDVEHEELHGETGPKIKVVVSFHGEPLSLVACKTNGLCLKAMFGPHVPNWLDKRVTLFASEWNGEPCIRVWGSPELERDEQVQIALPRRKPFVMTMRAVTDGKPRQSSRPEVSSAAQRLLESMKGATDALTLAHVADEVAAEEWPEAERKLLDKALAKRKAQLEESANG